MQPVSAAAAAAETAAAGEESGGGICNKTSGGVVVIEGRKEAHAAKTAGAAPCQAKGSVETPEAAASTRPKQTGQPGSSHKTCVYTPNSRRHKAVITIIIKE